jgi:hypothetical protein
MTNIVSMLSNNAFKGGRVYRGVKEIKMQINLNFIHLDGVFN